ncbi:hypothetical protein AcV5_004914 [Taiwanofungus camphoratus]|nr:hypothetical protein AcV5_004914 [Antrodia cinnamomea]
MIPTSAVGHASALELLFDPHSFETIEESPVSYITRARFREAHEDSQVHWAAIKSASTLPDFSKKPHDIAAELRLLCSIAHINVIDVLGHTFEEATASVHFWMPYIPCNLHHLLASPSLSPHQLPGTANEAPPDVQARSFEALVRSIAYQTIAAIAYLHSRDIAHRDIKPRNILLTATGCVKLIDFGIAWTDPTTAPPEAKGLWPEPPGDMCFDVSTGPYRAPELLFGPTTYDAFAIDLWSLGAMLAEFFTPLRLQRQHDEYDDDSASESDIDDGDAPRPPFIVTKPLAIGEPDTVWTRESLFDASRGSIGLAWSIFKVLGTPTEENWPAFKTLPDASKVTFLVVPPVDLQTLLPNLPFGDSQSKHGTLSGAARHPCIDLVECLLAYPPSMRLRVSEALAHPWFAEAAPLLLPEGCPAATGLRCATLWEGRTLRDLLSLHLYPTNSGRTS